MRALDYIAIASKDIRLRAVRSPLTVVALAISTVILVTLLAISLGAKQSIIQGLGLNNSLDTLLVTPNQNVNAGLLGGSVQIANDQANKLDDAAVQSLASLPHVVSASPIVSLWELKTFTIEDEAETFVAQASGVTPTTDSPALSAGRFFASNSTAHEVILGEMYAKQMGYDKTRLNELLGKKVTFTTQPAYRGDGAAIPPFRAPPQAIQAFATQSTTLTATIIGVSGENSTSNQILLPMDWARKIKTTYSYSSRGELEAADYIEKNGYGTISVQANDPAKVAALTEAISRKGYGVISTQQQIERINSITTIMWGLFGSVALISLTTACLGIANTILTTISEQRYSIGVWRAVGARRRVIALRFIIQAGLLGLLGGTIGATAGWYITDFTSKHISELLKAQNLPSLEIVHASPLLLAGAVATAVILAALSGVYPAWRAAREDPSSSLSAGQ